MDDSTIRPIHNSMLFNQQSELSNSNHVLRMLSKQSFIALIKLSRCHGNALKSDQFFCQIHELWAAMFFLLWLTQCKWVKNEIDLQWSGTQFQNRRCPPRSRNPSSSLPSWHCPLHPYHLVSFWEAWLFPKFTNFAKNQQQFSTTHIRPAETRAKCEMERADIVTRSLIGSRKSSLGQSQDGSYRHGKNTFSRHKGSWRGGGACSRSSASMLAPKSTFNFTSLSWNPYQIYRIDGNDQNHVSKF